MFKSKFKTPEERLDWYIDKTDMYSKGQKITNTDEEAMEEAFRFYLLYAKDGKDNGFTPDMINEFDNYKDLKKELLVNRSLIARVSYYDEKWYRKLSGPSQLSYDDGVPELDIENIISKKDSTLIYQYGMYRYRANLQIIISMSYEDVDGNVKWRNELMRFEDDNLFRAIYDYFQIGKTAKGQQSFDFAA